jgi:hypothetical protein
MYDMKMAKNESVQTCMKVAVAYQYVYTWRAKLSQAVRILGPGTEQEGTHMENKCRSASNVTKGPCGKTYASPRWHVPYLQGTTTETLAAVGWSRDVIWGCRRDAATKLGVEMKTTNVTAGSIPAVC